MFPKTELVEFSNKYGPYPFANEKHGLLPVLAGGGMEHQTFSAMSWQYDKLVGNRSRTGSPMVQ